MFAIFKTQFPDAVLEKASIDEAYLGAATCPSVSRSKMRLRLAPCAAELFMCLTISEEIADGT